MEYKGWNIHIRELPYQPFPLAMQTTTLLVLHIGRKEIRQYKAPETKLWALMRIGKRDIPLVTWPGRRSQDAFIVTDPGILASWLLDQGYEEKTPRWVG